MRFTRQEIISLLSICIGSFLIILDSNIVNIIIPDLREQLSLTISQSSWIVNSYVLAFASLILFFARWSKRIGAKNAFIAGITVFMVGSLFCGLSDSFTNLLISRIIQGIGAALFAPIATKLLSSIIIEPQKRAIAFGIWSGTSGIGFAFSPLVGGFLNELWGWQSIFFINIPFTVIVILTAFISIKDVKKENISMFFKEQITVVFFIVTFVYATHEYKIIDQSSLLLTVGSFMFLFFGWRYSVKFKQGQTNVISRQMFTKLNISSLINGFAYNFSIYGIMYFLSLYFQENLHLSSFETGIKFLPLTLSGMLISSFLSPILVNKLGKAFTQQLCLFAIVAGSMLLFIYFIIFQTPIFIAISFILLGSSGAIAPVLMNAAFLATNKIYHNEISSLVNLTRQMGSILSVMTVSIMLELFAKETTILYFLIVTIIVLIVAYIYSSWANKHDIHNYPCTASSHST
ncbi:MFS transporter [Shimazuella alba]|uniref:MFS transporter n=1 Tax=Shimazuella alba TaxID=2690964 RepID=A0A6I4VRD8_9BACL|nr:MFS transporter [Shimazuella alba]MXQ54227.1 MFS transporter [Shimazuella alba]